MIIKPSVMNVVSIGLMAFFGVWVLGRALHYVGANVSTMGMGDQAQNQ